MYSYNTNVTDENINTCVTAPKSGLFIITLPKPRMLNHVLITVRQGELFKTVFIILAKRCFSCQLKFLPTILKKGIPSGVATRNFSFDSFFNWDPLTEVKSFGSLLYYVGEKFTWEKT